MLRGSDELLSQSGAVSNGASMSPQPHHAADNNNDAKKPPPSYFHLPCLRGFPLDINRSGFAFRFVLLFSKSPRNDCSHPVGDTVSIEDESSPGTVFSIVAGHLGFFTQPSNGRMSVNGSLLYACLYRESSCPRAFRNRVNYAITDALSSLEPHDRLISNKISRPAKRSQGA
ncbi:hypothetical protein DBV15_03981 [Temnothorax longispinosus]|uniref:Uncharacterized protein n=1 Tax=Temnothorax longispinosus TaxID=300112 RepID=A0A4S2L4N3_9HYME|nr:hypothetical protein DBV15_03981 [Temnothorax longispinosus]